MKRVITVLGVLIIALLLVNCTKKKVRLEPPVNLRLENKILYWDVVPKATSYEIHINSDMYTVETNYFDISFLDEGDYEIRVKATASGYLSSYFSSVFYYKNTVILPIPSNLKIQDNKLVWDYIQYATSYTVKIADRTYDTEQNLFDLSFLEENKFYAISVRANYQNKSSDYSEVIEYHTFFNTYKNINKDFNRNSTDDLFIEFEDTITVSIIKNKNEEVVNETNYYVSDSTLTFLNSYLVDLDYGIYKYIIYSDKGIIMLEIKITDNRNPYLKSDERVVFSNEDLEFEFELYGGVIEQLTVSVDANFTNDDYRIEGNNLIIYREFIESVFAKDSQRKQIIFSYLLRKDNSIVVGYIFVMRE